MDYEKLLILHLFSVFLVVRVGVIMFKFFTSLIWKSFPYIQKSRMQMAEDQGKKKTKLSRIPS
jgi:hypothetical protein